jgi:PqqD family protein of HPr-rel-A system
VKFVHAPGIVARRIADELVLVCTEPPTSATRRSAGDFFVLSETAEELWAALAEPRTSEELAQWLLDRYELSPQQAAADVAGFLASLRDFGMVREVETP